MTFNDMFDIMFKDVWFFNGFDNMYIRVEGIEKGEDDGVIRCHYIESFNDELMYLGTDGWGSGEELKDATVIDSKKKISELNIALAKSMLLGENDG